MEGFDQYPSVVAAFPHDQTQHGPPTWWAGRSCSVTPLTPRRPERSMPERQADAGPDGKIAHLTTAFEHVPQEPLESRGGGAERHPLPHAAIERHLRPTGAEI